jgi:hypothetical protein
MTIEELEQEVGISRIHSRDLKMRSVSAKFVLRQLTTDKMECRMLVTGDLFKKSMLDLTCLSSLVFTYDPEKKMQLVVAHNVYPPKKLMPHQIQGKNYAHCIPWHQRLGAP